MLPNNGYRIRYKIKEMKTVKCVVVGDHSVGKTYVSNPTNTCPNQSDPKSYGVNNYSQHVMIDGKQVSLGLSVCTSGLKFEYNIQTLRFFLNLPNPEIDVFLICFSLVDPTSLDNVRKKWYPDLRYLVPNAPIILVGTKLDLREEWYRNESPKEAETISPITTDEGLSMSKELGAVKYLECSALTQKGLKNIYEEVIWTALRNRQRWRQCVII